MESLNLGRWEVLTYHDGPVQLLPEDENKVPVSYIGLTRTVTRDP